MVFEGNPKQPLQEPLRNPYTTSIEPSTACSRPKPSPAQVQLKHVLPLMRYTKNFKVGLGV